MTVPTLAIDGGTPTRTAPWPSWPIWDAEDERALVEVLHSGQWWSVGGERVPQFEQAFARLHYAKYGICVTNGTAALEVALRALDIGCGDEVIVPPYTFIATATSVLSVSATPVFADIDPETLCLNPKRAEAAITSRTRAIIPVHMAGCPADMDAFRNLGHRYGLRIIEDAAQAHLAEWKGVPVGALGDVGTFSFQASKNLNCGEGGILLTNSEDLADRIWSVHNVGRSRKGEWYEHARLGGNFRMTEFQAALLVTQMKRLEEQTRTRTHNADFLTELLGPIAGVTPVGSTPGVTRHARHLYIFRYSETHFGGSDRNRFLQALAAEGVPCDEGYRPLYNEDVFARDSRAAGCGKRQPAPAVDYPVCNAVCSDAVWLGQQLLLGTKNDMEDIANAIRKIQRAWTG